MAAESVATPEGNDPGASREGTAQRAPWRGRRRVENPRDKPLRIRCSTQELAEMEARAQTAGLSLGAFVRAAVLGSAGPRAVKRPRIETEQLARLLGQIGKLNSSVNQIAKHANATLDPPGAPELVEMKTDIAAMRAAVMQALGHGD